MNESKTPQQQILGLVPCIMASWEYGELAQQSRHVENQVSLITLLLTVRSVVAANSVSMSIIISNSEEESGYNVLNMWMLLFVNEPIIVRHTANG